MHIADYLILALIASAAVFALVRIWRHRGCGGCGACHGCAANSKQAARKKCTRKNEKKTRSGE